MPNVKSGSEVSAIQEQYWTLSQIHPESSGVNLCSVFYITGQLSVDCLHQSIQILRERHEILRSVYRMTENGLVQIAQSSENIQEKQDFFAAVPSEDEAAFYTDKIIRKPFDLEIGPLFRANLFCYGELKYIFVLVWHHSICDLRTKELLTKEIGDIYGCLLDGSKCVNGNTLFTYAMFSKWQREWLQSDDFRLHLDYWKSEFSDNPVVLDLPVDRNSDVANELTGDEYVFKISQEQRRDLEAIGEKNNATLFQVLLSLYLYLLSRYSSQEEIVIGLPYKNRIKKEFKECIGCFMNILPVRFRLMKNPTLGSVIEMVKGKMAGARLHQEVPFLNIFNAVNKTSESSLFRAGFTFDRPVRLDLRGADTEFRQVHFGGAQLDIMMYFMDGNGSLDGRIEYNTGLFDKTTIKRMSGHYLTLLGKVILSPDISLDEVSFLTAEEFDYLVNSVNKSAQLFDIETYVHELFQRQSSISPDSIAVECDGKSVTYKELDERSSQIANHLAANGAGPEKIIGLCIGRSVEMVAGILGVLKSGAAYVPIDPAFPDERISYILDDSNAALLLTHSELEKRFCSLKCHLVLLDKIEKTEEPFRSLIKPLCSENIAYVIYTSGSTGKPKGVEICHGSLINFIYSMQKKPGIKPKETVLSVTTISFDIAVLEILLPLTVGAKVSIVEKDAVADGQRLLEIIEKYRPSMIQATPSTWNILLESGWKSGSGINILCGGEPMTRVLADKLLATGATVWNMYGPTETTVWSSLWKVLPGVCTPPIGEPIANTQLYILSENLQPVPIGVKGELYIGGAGLARGYHNNPSLTKEKFIKNPFVKADSCGNASVMYKTGDLARRMPDGSIQVLGRNDFQVKIHGFRIELGEIESVIEKVDFVNQCAVIVREDFADDKHIVAYVTLRKNHSKENNITEELRKCITSNLPAYMNPSFYVILDDFPKTVSGKIDRKSLPKPDYSESINKNTQNVNYTEEETTVASVWQKTLKVDKIPVDINFFDAGGTSLLAVKLASELQRRFNRKIPVSFIFQYPSIKVMSAVLNKKDNVTVETAVDNKAIRNSVADTDDIAVVGMSCRFPGSENLSEYWKSLCDARDEISFFSDQQMPADVDISIRNNEMYVRAKGVLKSVNQFDPDFFGLTHQVADITDPQIRLFLEHSYDALENAGFSQRQSDVVGVYASMGRSQYLRHNILTRPDIVDKMGELQIELGNEKDYIATRLSHTLNLTGPSVSVSTACSSSLVAIIMACQAIKHGECNMAVAGGSNITFPLYRGYLYQEGAIHSSDGHCRPFDSSASGTVFSDGVGVVVLKKLSQALADKNIIYAIVKGGAINNDGLQKASYTAPGINGQISVIRSAQEAAGVAPETIGYVETHGTATPLGDPVEIDALTQAFRKTTDKKQFCAIGSVKGNIGHTAISAGVAGFIKTALMLYYKKLVPSINFKSANPAINFGESPFFVNTGLKEWPLNGSARRAAVSSFGFGGTNSHLILEEASLQNGGDDRRRWKLLPFSAKTESSLNSYLKRFTEYATANPRVSLSNIAFTLQTGRINYKYRRFFVCSETSNVLADLKQTVSADEKPFCCDNNPVKIVFIFPGQGSQYLKMAEDFYKKERIFQSEFDRCARVINRELNVNIADILFSENELNSEKINDVLYSQTALFAVEYALSCLLKSWGIVPDELIGHSVGEFVAASVSGIMSVEDAACLVAIRARLLQSLPQGSMLSVRLTETELLKKLPDDLTIASVNSPVLCVISGNTDSIMNFQKECEKDNIACSMLESSHAFHSSMVNPAVDAFGEAVRKTVLSEPGIPVVSTVTGKYLTKEEATGAEYWTRHMCVTVRFSDAIKTVKGFSENRFFLEVGPKATCTACINQHEWDKTKYRAMPTLPETHEDELDYKEILTAAGELWLRGITIDWNSFYRDEKLIQVSLPSYPFERQTYWVEPGKTAALLSADIDAEDKKSNEIQKTAALPEIEKIESAVPDAAAEIRSIIAQETGVNVSDIEDSETFLQMGLDSLFLTQFSQTIKSKFNITVTLRQLMREHNSVSKLDKFISCSMGG